VFRAAAFIISILLFTTVLTSCATENESYDDDTVTTVETELPAETAKASSSDSHTFMYMSPVYFNFISNCIYDQWSLEEQKNLSEDYTGLKTSLHAYKTFNDINMDVYYYEFEQVRNATDVYNALIEPRMYDVDYMEIQQDADISNTYADMEMSAGYVKSYNYFRVDNKRVIWGTCGAENQGAATKALKNMIEDAISTESVDSAAESVFKFNKTFSYASVISTLEAANFTFEPVNDKTYNIGSSINTAVGSLYKSNSATYSLCSFVNSAVKLQNSGYTVTQCTITSNMLTFKCENLETQRYCYCLVFDDNELRLENSISSFKADMALVERLWTK
jgi:hypothetical protein